jgi:hypothetical protein
MRTNRVPDDASVRASPASPLRYSLNSDARAEVKRECSFGAAFGAAFGATLYRDLILFGATECDVDNESISFILLRLFGLVRDGATRCIGFKNRT